MNRVCMNFNAVSIDYVWVMYGLCMDHVRVMHKVYMDYVWIMYGLCMGHVWILANMC